MSSNTIITAPGQWFACTNLHFTPSTMKSLPTSTARSRDFEIPKRSWQSRAVGREHQTTHPSDGVDLVSPA
eukprot:31056-Pelagococcus_subviridis.AAC.8